MSFQNGDLRITGDSDNNTVKVTQNANAIGVEGLQGTTINGNPVLLILTQDIPDDVLISFAAGGNNTLLMENLQVGDDVQVRGGRERDSIAFINGDIGDDLKVRTGNGNDTFYLESTDVEDIINVNTGSGSDKVAIGGSDMSAERMLINTGRGRDGVIVGEMRVRADVEFKTGSGNDSVFISDFHANGDLKASMSGGNDSLYVEDADVAGDTIVNGSSGTDSAQAVNSAFGSSPTLNSIESGTVANPQARAINLALRILDEFAAL